MHRAFVGDVQEARPLLVIDFAFDRQPALDAVEAPALGLAVRTVLGVDLVVGQGDGNPRQGPAFALRIETQSHGGAGAEPSQHQIIGARSAVVAADGDRLVGPELMAPGGNPLGKLALPGLLDHHRSRGGLQGLLFGQAQIAARPTRQHLGHIGRVLVPGQQVIGIVERNEALRVLRGGEDPPGVFDPDRRIARRVKHQQSLAKAGDRLFQAGRFDIFEELLLDGEGPAGEQHFGLAFGLDLGAGGLEQVLHVPRIGRRTDGGHRHGLWDPARRGEDRGPAQAVSDDDLRRLAMAAQMVGGGHQVAYVRREVGVGELALAVPQSGEVEAQHRDPARCQPRRDARGGEDVLRAGEAVGEEGHRMGAPLGLIEPGRELLPVGAGKAEFLAGDRHHAPQASG